ncbi:hypothetical protein [Paenibacillus peoriae]|uniref:hypothetical protein n=1 Tax=Paenibacillus peoriae TaxID=59893 RepID=UPI000FA50A7B|nr:hypothetical protein [Paenibacillus peoriae]
MIKQGIIVLLLLCTGNIGVQSEGLSNQLDNRTVIWQQNEETNGDELTPEEAQKVIASRAEQVIRALKDSNMKKLKGLVHPKKGVRFSPDATIQVNGDLLFKGKELEQLIRSDKVYEWGSYDGSGNPIKLTFQEYLNSFIYDRDYANAERKAYNQFIMHSSSTDNLREIYPHAIFVEYNFSKGVGSSDISELMWSSLRIIFEYYKGEWYLVGISHDHWTI